MRKFKVLECPTEKTFVQVKPRRDDNGNLVYYQVFSVVKVGEIPPGKKEPWYPGAYGNEKIAKGDVIEINGHLADKAANNPQFEEVFETPKLEAPVKRKPGRPRKEAA